MTDNSQAAHKAAMKEARRFTTDHAQCSTYHEHMLALLRPQIEAAAREAALREAANRALLSVSAIRSVCDMHGAVSCSLQNQGKDCLCQEREEQAEYINQKILALIKKEPTNAG